MITTLIAGQSLRVALDPGKVLTIVSGPATTAIVRGIATPGENVAAPSMPMTASKTKNYGPFTAPRTFQIEVTTGSVTVDTVDAGQMAFATLRGNVEAVDASFTLRADDNGKIFRSEAGADITITVPPDLPEGFNVGASKWGVGNVIFAAGTGATARSVSLTVSTLYSVGSLMVMKNANGVSAEFVTGGDVA